jgi:hypothetical protein
MICTKPFPPPNQRCSMMRREKGACLIYLEKVKAARVEKGVCY